MAFADTAAAEYFPGGEVDDKYSEEPSCIVRRSISGDDWIGERSRRGVSKLKRVRGEIEEVIARSRDEILSLPEDFDGEGGEGYAAETIDRAADLLRWLAKEASTQARAISVPHIDHGQNGSIDLYWKLDSCELLINVPADASSPTFYGDDYGTSVTKGRLDSHKNRRVLLTWLIEHQE